MTAYYNEIDPFAAQWLRELIKQNLIAPGEVDERSIEDVTPSDLKGFTQCHFFAGIGVWSHALRSARWPDDRPVWTGSCPCQPFSTAGKGAGFADERHLWPAFHWLIHQCRPVVVFGEQVAGKAGETWLDLVSNDLENTGYSCGSAVTAACGFGAPHQRKRLYWVADAESGRERCGIEQTHGSQGEYRASGGSSIVADAKGVRLEGRRGEDSGGSATGIRAWGDGFGGGVIPCIMADTSSTGLPTRQHQELPGADRDDQGRAVEQRSGALDQGLPGPTNGFWRDADWIGCRDGKWRPVEPGSQPLADGAPTRVGRLRGYGNAIVAQQAQAFIEAYCEVRV